MVGAANVVEEEEEEEEEDDEEEEDSDPGNGVDVKSSPVAHTRRRVARIALTGSVDLDFLRGCFRCRLTLVCCESKEAKSADLFLWFLLLIISSDLCCCDGRRKGRGGYQAR